jgi:hypothetical protein
MSSLTDLYISDSYTGLLHAGGISLPVTGQITMYDGSGQVSSLSLGIAGQGADITGRLTTDNLTVGTLVYPSTPGSVGSFLYQENSTSLGFITEDELFPNIIEAGTYDRIKSIQVTDKGFVTDINQWPTDGSNTTITFTTYFNGAIKQGDITFENVVPGGIVESDWVLLNLTGAYDDMLAGIFFLEPLDQQDLSGQTRYVIYVSPDGTDGNRVPVLAIEGDEDDETMVGTQFNTVIGDGQLFFKIVTTLGDVDAVTYRIWGVARQG